MLAVSIRVTEVRRPAICPKKITPQWRTPTDRGWGFVDLRLNWLIQSQTGFMRKIKLHRGYETCRSGRLEIHGRATVIFVRTLLKISYLFEYESFKTDSFVCVSNLRVSRKWKRILRQKNKQKKQSTSNGNRTHPRYLYANINDQAITVTVFYFFMWKDGWRKKSFESKKT